MLIYYCHLERDTHSKHRKVCSERELESPYLVIIKYSITLN